MTSISGLVILEVLNPESHQPPKVIVTWEMLCSALLFRLDHLVQELMFTDPAVPRKPFFTKQYARTWKLTWLPLMSRKIFEVGFLFMSKQLFVSI